MIDRASHNDELIRQLEQMALPLRSADGLDPLMQAVGDACFVLLGEATASRSAWFSKKIFCSSPWRVLRRVPLDAIRAPRPLHFEPEPEAVPETFPTGM